MKVAEFDKFAEEYLATHKTNLAVTGESPDYFARYKIVEIARRLKQLGLEPRRVLDFGCGIGSSAPHLREAFPDAEITESEGVHRVVVRATFMEGLLRHVLSLGSECEVVGPPEACEQLREMVQRVLERHGGAKLEKTG